MMFRRLGSRLRVAVAGSLDLWVTAFDPDERYAAGDTPNQNPGAPGLPQYVRDNQGLVNRDLVSG